MKRHWLIMLIILILSTTLLATNVFGELKEDIIRSNSQNAQVVNVDGRWKIAADNMWLLDFGPNQVQANQALQVIFTVSISSVYRQTRSIDAVLSLERYAAGKTDAGRGQHSF